MRDSSFSITFESLSYLDSGSVERSEMTTQRSTVSSKGG